MSSDEEDSDEGGGWVAGEWQSFGGKRRRRPQSKEEILYGVFGDYPDDNFYRSKQRSLHTGVAFQSAGTMDPNADEDGEKGEEKSKPNDIEVAPAKGKRPHSPLPQHFGRGEMEDEEEALMEPDVSEPVAHRGGLGWSEQSLRSNLPTSFASGAPKKSALKRKREESEEELPSVNFSKDFGKFEQHTKGIGMKLMKMMGFKGRLGKNETGRAEPVIAKVRRRNAGLNYDGEDQREEDDYRNAQEKAAAQRKKQKEEAEKRQVVAGWKKTDAPRPKKVYVTSAELIQRKSLPKKKKTELVLDFTQSESGQAVDITEAVGPTIEDEALLPELRHNVGKIVELVELEILSFDTEYNRSQSSLKSVNSDRNILSNRLSRERETIDRTKRLIAILDDLAVRLGDSYDPNFLPGDEVKTSAKKDKEEQVSLDELANIFEEIQTKYREEYTQFGVCGLAVSAVFPRIKQKLDEWKPMEDPTSPEKLMARWRYLLSSHSVSQRNKSPETTDVYTELMEKVVVPKLRSTLMNEWDVKKPQKCVEMFESLEKYVPHGIVYRLLSTLVVPNIARSVDMWEPSKETVPIDQWILPWLGLLADELRPVCDKVYYKINETLRHWQFGDSSCLLILTPWIGHFTSPQMKNLIKTRILPKLHMEMGTFEVNPRTENFKTIALLNEWEDLIDTNHFVMLFEKRFFPKFHAVLHRWLTATDPQTSKPSADLSQVAQWYEIWKTHFSDKLLSHPRFIEQLNIALDMMNCVVLKHSLPDLKTVLETCKSHCAEIPLATSARRARPSGAPRPPPPPSSSLDDEDEQMSFRELVERFAQANNVLFVPNTSLGRYHGKQIFQFGSYNVYLDSELIFVKRKGEDWKPTSLNELLK